MVVPSITDIYSLDLVLLRVFFCPTMHIQYICRQSSNKENRSNRSLITLITTYLNSLFISQHCPFSILYFVLLQNGFSQVKSYLSSNIKLHTIFCYKLKVMDINVWIQNFCKIRVDATKWRESLGVFLFVARRPKIMKNNSKGASKNVDGPHCLQFYPKTA